MHNIEKSAFRRGAYVGWDAAGNRYHVTRPDPRGKWQAVRVLPNSLRIAHPVATHFGRTLREISAKLEG